MVGSSSYSTGTPSTINHGTPSSTGVLRAAMRAGEVEVDRPEVVVECVVQAVDVRLHVLPRDRRSLRQVLLHQILEEQEVKPERNSMLSNVSNRERLRKSSVGTFKVSKP